MKSLYMWWARFGSNSEEWMSTQTDGCFCLKSSGSSVYGIRWNHISFMVGSLQVRLTVSRSCGIAAGNSGGGLNLRRMSRDARHRQQGREAGFHPAQARLPLHV